MNRHIAVLGAGRGQIPLIDILHRYGLKVTCISKEGDYPGFKIADNYIYEDVSDKNAILRAVQELGADAVISDQLDCAVTTSAYVTEKLNMRGIPYDISLKFVDKPTMRQEAIRAGINVPKYIVVSTVHEIKEKLEKMNLNMPLIMKPVDASASRGIHKVYSFPEIMKCFEDAKKWSSNGKVIIEQLIVGKEYVIDSYTHDFVTTPLVVGRRSYFKIGGTFIPSSTIFVDALSAMTEDERKVVATNVDYILKSGLEYGITHGEYIVEESTGDVYLVEIAARGGGVFISSDLIPTACGVNAVDLLVRDTLGFAFPHIDIHPGASAYLCYLLPQGTIKNIYGTDCVGKIKGVTKAFFDNIELNMCTSAITDKGNRKGPILIKGKNRQECLEIIEQVKNTLAVEVMTPNGIQPIIWQ